MFLTKCSVSAWVQESCGGGDLLQRGEITALHSHCNCFLLKMLCSCWSRNLMTALWTSTLSVNDISSFIHVLIRTACLRTCTAKLQSAPYNQIYKVSEMWTQKYLRGVGLRCWRHLTVIFSHLVPNALKSWMSRHGFMATLCTLTFILKEENIYVS